jgi:flagellar biosynthetic protein FliR
MIEAFPFLGATGEVATFALVLMRTSGLVTFCPILGAETLPARVRVLLALALALALRPVVPEPAVLPAGAVEWTAATVRELSVGFGLGLAARAVFSGIEAAGALVGTQTGFAMASLIDPDTGANSLAPQMFQSLLAATLFLAADLHHLFLHGLAGSYELLPSGAALPDASRLADAASFLGLRVFEVTIQLAAPALVVALACDFVVLLVGRALPQIPVLVIAYPAKVAVGLVAMAVLATATGSVMGWIGRTVASDGARMLAAMGGR